MNDHCADNCPVLPRVEALESANKEHGKRIGNLEAANAAQNAHLENIMEDVREIKKDNKAIIAKLNAMELKPAKRWESLVDKLLFAAAGAVIAWISAGMPM